MTKAKELPESWAPYLASQPETGMGYWVATVKTNNGKAYKRVVIIGGTVVSVYGYDEIPFEPNDITEIIITHDKWDFNAKENAT